MRKAGGYNYAALLCKKGGAEVRSAVFNGYNNKAEVYRDAGRQYPDWNVKTIVRLYYEDFANEK